MRRLTVLIILICFLSLIIFYRYIPESTSLEVRVLVEDHLIPRGSMEPPTSYRPTYYRVTAYCGCPVCCGIHADYRPDGNVVGAQGVPLVEGIHVAMNNVPLGTEVYIEGLGIRVVSDRIAVWVEKKFGETVDIYFEEHEDAQAFGRQILKVEIIL
jgi:3D (Asp-Asp-Asp) domain-containing protein